MRRERVWPVASVSAAVIAFAAAGYVLSDRGTVPNAGTVPSGAGVSAAALPPGSTGGPSAPGDRSGPSDGARPTVTFLGDDYTLGIGASGPDQGFTALLGARLGVSAVSVGVDGGGYARAGAGGRTYADLVGQVVASHPDVVVVSGGRNDFVNNVATVGTDARDLFAELHRRLPDARLVAVAPFWGDSPTPEVVTKIGAAVRAAVTAAGGTYLDLPDPLTGHPSWMADAADPDDAGYAAIARALAPELAPLLTDDGGG